MNRPGDKTIHFVEKCADYYVLRSIYSGVLSIPGGKYSYTSDLSNYGY